MIASSVVTKLRPGSDHPQRSYPAIVISCMLCLLLNACASWQVPATFDVEVLRARAISETVQGVRLSAAVLSTEDSRQMFGADVNRSGVQPVWVEVNNSTGQVLWLLRSGTDPDLFSPHEAAWSFRKAFAGERNDRLIRHFDSLSFQNPIAPGTTQSGILFTNPHRKTRLLNIDILGHRQLFPFTLFLPVPGDESYEAITISKFNQLIAAAIVDYPTVDQLRATLESLTCCATGTDAAKAGDPVNVILVGEPDDVAAALVRRGFRIEVQDFDNAQHFFGRPPDVVVRKTGQAGVPANWLRMWVAPFRYQGQSVLLVQAGRPLGWRYAVHEEEDPVLNPNVDEVRNLLIQDLLYSSGLEKIAFVTGVGATRPGETRNSLGGGYYTDGLRAVLFLTSRPLSLSDFEVLDWYPALKLREIDAIGANERGEN